MRRVTVAALIGAFALGACSGAEADRSAPAPVVAEATTTITPAYDRVFTLAFGGDTHFEDELRPLLDRPEDALEVIAPLLRDAELTVVNLETAITTRGTPEPKEFTFRTSPKALDALSAAGVDVASVANNHGVDYGPTGLEDTLAAKKDSPIGVIGVGATAAEAFAPYEATIEGTKVAIIGATDVIDSAAADWAATDDRAGIAVAGDRLVSAVRDASTAFDVVVVFLHWGSERVDCPTAKQRSLADELATAGADAVIGSHAHVLLGSGWLGRTYVNYGLGNFVWYNARTAAGATTGVLTVTIRDGAVAEHSWAPAKIPTGGGVPKPVTGAAADAAVEAWNDLRGCTNLSTEPGRLR